MLKILLPIDGSEAAERAAQYVVHRASQLKEPIEVQLLNVQPPVQSRRGGANRPGEDPGREELLRNEGNKALAPARNLLEAAGIKHRHHVDFGEPAELIEHYGKIYHCDEIVMGTRGKTSILNLVLGSVTNKVLHVATVPIVLVK